MCYVDRALSLSLTQTVRATGGDSSVIVTVSQLEGFVFDPRPLSESPQRSLGKSVHLNRPDKKQISDCGLPPTPVTKIKLKLAHCTRKNADWDLCECILRKIALDVFHFSCILRRLLALHMRLYNVVVAGSLHLVSGLDFIIVRQHTGVILTVVVVVVVLRCRPTERKSGCRIWRWRPPPANCHPGFLKTRTTESRP